MAFPRKHMPRYYWFVSSFSIEHIGDSIRNRGIHVAQNISNTCGKALENNVVGPLGIVQNRASDGGCIVLRSCDIHNVQHQKRRLRKCKVLLLLLLLLKDIEKSRMCACVWVEKQEMRIYLGHCKRHHVGLKILLLLAGDIEPCPRPCQKCTTCKMAIRKNQSCEKCYTCGQKFHLRCLVDQMTYGCKRVYCRSCVVDKTNQSRCSNSRKQLPNITTFLRARGLKLFHLNINRLAKKIDDVKVLLLETKNYIDIFGITETHLRKNICDGEIGIEGYTFIRNDRGNDLGGRVGCYIRNGLGWQGREDLEKTV